MVYIIKYLANIGVASRRKVQEMIQQGGVVVNNQVVINPALLVDPLKDEILVDGKKIKNQKNLVYIILNKPKGVVSTASDEHDRATVVSLVGSNQRLYPVGRLDQTSSGLILLTNDGDLANKLTHPKFYTPKTYEVLVVGIVSPGQIIRLQTGINLKEGKTAPAEVEILEDLQKKTVLKIVIYEGKNHQVKRMCSMVGLEVLALKRVAIGSIGLGNLKPGEYRELTHKEISLLKK